MDDQRLLQEYADRRSEAAFAELVLRHIDMVYGVCVRQLRHAQDAEDAAQAVFIQLARQAGSLREGTVVAAWLHHVARMESVQMIRKATIRRRHEMAAASQLAHQEAPQPSDLPDDEIDRALGRLRTPERAAILLRFFRGQTFEQVAGELQISEEAARKRVSRGLEKLRRMLRPLEGPALSVSGVEAILHASVHAAPPALAAATVKAVAAHVGAAAAGTSLAKGAVITMAISKTKVALVAVAALLLVGGGTVAVSHYVNRARDEAVAIRAGAPAVAPVNAVTSAPAVTYHGPPIVGYARFADGTPVAGASVFVSDPEHFLSLYGSKDLAPPRLIYGTIHASKEGSFEVTYGKNSILPLDVVAESQATTAADGRFQFTPSQTPIGLVVRSPQGIGIATAADVVSGHLIVVKPWARVEGNNWVGTQPLPKADVSIQKIDLDVLNAAQVNGADTAKTDASGHFVIPRAIPGRNMINRTFAYHGDLFLGRGGHIQFATFPPGIWLTQVIDVTAGQTTYLRIGGVGRPIVGRVAQRLDAFAYRRGILSADPPLDSENSFPFDFDADGSFMVHDMPAGRYRLHADFGNPAGPERPLPYHFLKYIASADTQFVVPPISGGRSDEPFDVGDFPLTLLPQLALGNALPELDLRMLDGSSVRLGDYRGKYLLLQIWSKSRRYLSREQERLRSIDDRFGADPRLALLGVNTDDKPREACQSAIEAGVRWPQAMLANPSRGLPELYNNSGSALYLIDLQGNLMAKDLDELTTYGTLEGLLGRSASSAHVLIERELPGSVDAQTPFKQVVAPTAQNAAYRATVTIVDGKRDLNSGTPQRLVDGLMPTGPNSPGQSFFFDKGTLEGRLQIDLGRAISIGRINTFSWHTDNRAPQVYRIYGSDGSSKAFNASPAIGTDPTSCGWTKIAAVDTRPSQGPLGGRYAVSISDPTGPIGRFRYLLLVSFAIETRDDWGQTFFSDINVFEK